MTTNTTSSTDNTFRLFATIIVLAFVILVITD